MELLSIPVSLGELVDKYTILDIKEGKISDPEKLQHIQREKGVLKSHLNTFPHLHYLRFLTEINEVIWGLSDEIRENPDPTKCVDIIKHNDRRFRVKNKINRFSLLKEQKSYPAKKAMFCGHMETGDTINSVGIVRYLSTLYDEVVVPVKDVNLRMAKSLYEDDPSIKAVSINDVLVDGNYLRYNEYENNRKFIDQTKQSGVEVISVFYLGYNPPIPFSNSRFYDQFYTDAGIDPKLRFVYTHIPRNPHVEEAVKEKFIGDKNYVFVHNKIGDPRRIPTTDHYIFNVNECGGNDTPILHFCKMLEDAEEIHLDNSSFFCLAMYLDLSKVKRSVVYARDYHCDMMGYINPSQKWEVIYPSGRH